MIIPINEKHNEFLMAGDILTVTPVSAAIVDLSFSDSSTLHDGISTVKRYGPYSQDLIYNITAIEGSVTATKSKLQSPGFVEGWDDIRLPVHSISLAGAGLDAPAVDVTLTDYPGTLLFSGSADNILTGVVQIPTSWKWGTTIRPHIYWSKPVGSASATTWTFYYRVLGLASSVHGAWVGPVAVTATSGTPAVTDSMIISSFGEVDLLTDKEATVLAWKLHRLGSTDADNGTARLFTVNFRYLKNKSGLVSELLS